MKGRDKRRKARALKALRQEVPKKWTLSTDFKTQASFLARQASDLNAGSSDEALQRLTAGIAKPPLTLSTQPDLLPPAKKVS